MSRCWVIYIYLNYIYIWVIYENKDFSTYKRAVIYYIILQLVSTFSWSCNCLKRLKDQLKILTSYKIIRLILQPPIFHFIYIYIYIYILYISERKQNAHNDGDRAQLLKRLLEILFVAIKKWTGFTTGVIYWNTKCH